MDRYAPLHVSINGPGDSRPTAEQIIKDEGLAGKLRGKNILITGGTAGLGKESARVLRQTGAKVWITARTKSKGEEVANSISNYNEAYPAIGVIDMDLSDLNSVRRGAQTFLEQCPTLNVLMTNAGVMACPEQRTAQNFEIQFATNHLAHFLLFQLLKPALLAASTTSFNSRVISLSSAGHHKGTIVPGNYNFEGERVYDPFEAYGQSKTANILMANEIERRFGSRGLHAWSVHPGVIFETEISRHQEGGRDGLQKSLQDEHAVTTLITKNTEQGTATQVWAAIGSALEGQGGLYLEDLGVSKPAREDQSFLTGGHAPYIYDDKLGRRLWADSLEMVKISDED